MKPSTRNILIAAGIGGAYWWYRNQQANAAAATTTSTTPTQPFIDNLPELMDTQPTAAQLQQACIDSGYEWDDALMQCNPPSAATPPITKPIITKPTMPPPTVLTVQPVSMFGVVRPSSMSRPMLTTASPATGTSTGGGGTGLPRGGMRRF